MMKISVAFCPWKNWLKWCEKIVYKELMRYFRKFYTNYWIIWFLDVFDFWWKWAIKKFNSFTDIELGCGRVKIHYKWHCKSKWGKNTFIAPYSIHGLAFCFDQVITCERLFWLIRFVFHITEPLCDKLCTIIPISDGWHLNTF